VSGKVAVCQGAMGMKAWQAAKAIPAVWTQIRQGARLLLGCGPGQRPRPRGITLVGGSCIDDDEEKAVLPALL